MKDKQVEINGKKHIGNKEKTRRANQKIIYLKREIKEQQKVIELMAKQLITPIHSEEWIIDYYYKKANKEQI